MWLNKDLINKQDKILCEDISPRIVFPLSTEPLDKLIGKVEALLNHNFIPSLLVIAGTTLSFHYVMEVYGGFPITVAVGDSETGKSTAIRAGLSLTAFLIGMVPSWDLCRYWKYSINWVFSNAQVIPPDPKDWFS